MSWIYKKDGVDTRNKPKDGASKYVHDYYKSQIEALERDKASLKHESETSVLRNSHYEQEIMRLEREKRSAQNTLIYHQAEMESLKTELSRQRKSNMLQLKTKTDEFERKVTDQEREMDELCRQIIALEKTGGPNQINKYNLEIRSLTEQLSTANRRNDRLRNNVEELDKNCHALEKENRDLRVQLVLVEAKYGYKQQPTQDKNKLQQPSTQKELEVKIEKLEKDLESATKKAMEESNHSMKSKYLEEEVARLKLDHKESIATIANLQNKNGQLEMQVLISTERLKNQEKDIQKLRSELKEQETIHVQSEGRLEEQQRELEKLKKELEKILTKEKNKRKENVEDLLNQNDFMQKDLSKFLSNTQEAEIRLKNKGDQMGKLKQLIEHNEYLQKKVTELEQEKIELLRQNTDISKAKSHALASLELKEEHIKNLLNENKKTESSLQQKRKDTQEINKELESRNREIRTLRNENDNIQTQMMDVKAQAENTVKRIQEDEHKYQELMEEKENLDRSVNELEFRVRTTGQQLDHELSQGKLRQRTIGQLQSENQFLRKQVTDMSKAKDDALSRLSKITESKLNQGTPQLADNNDSSRPSRVVEMFSELYDSVWTDAFEEINGVVEKEEDTIKLLFNILKLAYDTAVHSAQSYADQIHSAIHTIPSVEEAKENIKFSGDIQIQKALADIRLSMGSVTSNAAEELFLPQLRTMLSRELPSGHLTLDTTYTYGRRCVSVCWLMRIREPPMYLEFKKKWGSAFDENLYKIYTKQGRQIKFIVWPVLYLHEKGPLLSKGVAQAL